MAARQSALYCLASFSLAIVCDAAAAQTTAPVPAKAGDKAATEVIVTAKKNDVSDRIDRRVYDIKNDPGAQTGVAADVLTKLPSVQVTPAGKVTLRGDANVTVLVDGKYPANGNQVIQTLASADIDRIEIMTNPSAQYAPDGTGGIINIITRKKHPLGVSGSLNARVGTLGRTSLAGSAAFSGGPWSIDSRLSVTHTPVRGTSRMQRTLPNAQSDSGGWIAEYDILLGNLNIGYKLGGHGVLTLEGQAYQASDHAHGWDSYRSAGVNYDGSSISANTFHQGDIEGVYEYNNETAGSHFTLDADHTSFRTTTRDSTVEAYAGGGVSDFGDHSDVRGPEDNIKADYEHRYSSGNELTAGLQWDRRVTSSDKTYDGSGIVAGTVPDGFHHNFTADQAISSAYVTWQQPFGKWTVLPGLRAEWQRLGIASEGLRARSDGARLYPSLHLDRAMGGKARLKLSYARRVQRPDINAYDPAVSQFGATIALIGNPDLKPSDTDAFEAEYETSGPSRNFAVTLYYHATHDVLTSYSYLSGGILYTQPVNGGESHAGGLELTLKAPLSTHWKYALSANLADSDVPQLGGGRRKAFTDSGNGLVEYDAPGRDGRPGDQYQLNFSVTGRQYGIQGYTTGTWRLDATWQHPLTKKISLVVTAFDIADSQGQTTIIDTPALKARTLRHYTDRAVRVALAWKFGTKK